MTDSNKTAQGYYWESVKKSLTDINYNPVHIQKINDDIKHFSMAYAIKRFDNL